MARTEKTISPLRSLEGLRLTPIRQQWDQPQVDDIRSAVATALESAGAFERMKPGHEIAITAGSRGIAALPEVLCAIVREVKRRDARPFLLPAMGSHGGGTAAGQVALLAGLGITEATVGAPIRASMNVVRLGETADGVPAYLDAIASEADGIIVVNRVKKHTNFDGPIESGVCKMAVIGMGKHAGAVAVHQCGTRAFGETVLQVAEIVLEKARIVAGVALLENARGGLADIVGMSKRDIILREPDLLRRAKDLCGKIPFHDIDILVVERMGKEFSGTGMDCYVIGRKRIMGEPEWPEAPHVSSLVALRLTEKSRGNGLGVGLADFTTRRLVDEIDWEVTKANVMTSGNLERVKIPLVYDTDREALEAAAFRERRIPVEKLSVACIRDTLNLESLLVSGPLAEEARRRPDLVVTGPPCDLPFDASGAWHWPQAVASS